MTDVRYSTPHHPHTTSLHCTPQHPHTTPHSTAPPEVPYSSSLVLSSGVHPNPGLIEPHAVYVLGHALIVIYLRGWREEGRGGVEGGGVRWGGIQSLSNKSTTHTHIHTHSSRVRGVNFVHAYVLVTCGRENINKRVLHHNKHSHSFHTTSDP